jgi:hypothetical protein
MKRIIPFALFLSTAVFTHAPAFADAVRRVSGDFPAKTLTYEADGKVVAREVYENEFTLIGREGAIPDGIVKEYYDTGKIRLVQNYCNARLEGTSREYYADGKIREERNYQNGDRNGVTREYDRNGRLKSESYYKDGLPWGPVVRHGLPEARYVGSALFSRYAVLGVWALAIAATCLLSIQRDRSTVAWLTLAFLSGPLALLWILFLSKSYDRMNYSYPYSVVLANSARGRVQENNGKFLYGIFIIGWLELAAGVLCLFLAALLLGSFIRYGTDGLGLAVFSLAAYTFFTGFMAYACLLIGGHTIRLKESGRSLSIILSIIIGTAGLFKLTSGLFNESFMVYLGLFQNVPKSLFSYTSTILYALAIAIIYYFTRPEVKNQFN